jgi:malonate transporter and related proteins
MSGNIPFDLIRANNFMAFLTATIPMFLLIFAGYVAGRRIWIDEGGIKGLSTFAFYFALPLMLFRLMADVPLADQFNGRFIVFYLVGGIVVYLMGAAISRWVFKNDPAEQGLNGMAASFGNQAIIALPIALDVFGPSATLPITMLVVFEGVVFMPLTIIILEICRNSRSTDSGIGSRALVSRAPLVALKSVLFNPVIAAMLLGGGASVIDFQLPDLLDSFIGLVSAAAIPCALFALGASLSRRKISERIGQTGAMVAIKMLVYPAVMFLVMGLMPGLDPVWRATAILAAAMPMGANLYLVAESYNVNVGRASAGVLFSAALAAVTISALTAILAAGLP